MAKEVQTKPVSFNPVEMLELSDEELQTARGGGKRSNYDTLTNSQLELLHKKIRVNKKIIEAVETGKITSARFHIIDDQPENETLTKEFSIGQELTFTKDGASVTVPIKTFVEGGSQKYLEYERDGKTVKFKLTNISAKTDKGNKSLQLF